MDLSQVLASSDVFGHNRPAVVNQAERSTMQQARNFHEEDQTDKESDISYADVSTLDTNDGKTAYCILTRFVWHKD